MIKLCNALSLPQYLKLFWVLAVHIEDTASLCIGPVAFALINGLMYDCAAKAKAYGNQLVLCWYVRNESRAVVQFSTRHFHDLQHFVFDNAVTATANLET